MVSILKGLEGKETKEEGTCIVQLHPWRCETWTWVGYDQRLVSRWTCRWGPFWRPPNLMDRLDTLIVFLLVECIKWLPPTDGCTVIGPYLWRLSIESWEEVGTSELAWVWSNWSEKSRCGGHFLDDVDPRNNCCDLPWRAGVIVECQFTYNDFCFGYVGCVSGVVFVLGGSLWKNSYYSTMWVFHQKKHSALSGIGQKFGTEIKANPRSSSIRKRVKRWSCKSTNMLVCMSLLYVSIFIGGDEGLRVEQRGPAV